MKTKRIAVIGTAAIFAFFCLLPTAGSSDQESLISPEIGKLVRKSAVTNRDPKNNDMSELLSRLVLAESEGLDQESLKRTILRANNPEGGYGLWDNGGIKRLFSIYILLSAQRNEKIHQLESANEEQRIAIERLQSELSELKSRLDKIR